MVVLTDFINFLEIHLTLQLLDMLLLTDFEISQRYNPKIIVSTHCFTKLDNFENYETNTPKIAVITHGGTR